MGAVALGGAIAVGGMGDATETAALAGCGAASVAILMSWVGEEEICDFVPREKVN